jgi:hypothetical protein
VGVGQLVADDDQRCFPTGRGLLQNVVNGKIGVGGGQSNHTLMGVGEGHGVQLSPVNADNDSPRVLCLGGQTL